MASSLSLASCDGACGLISPVDRMRPRRTSKVPPPTMSSPSTTGSTAKCWLSGSRGGGPSACARGEAAAGTGGAPDASADVAREAGPPPVVITVAGECGSPSGPTCPVTYLGTTALGLRSSDGVIASLAPDESLFLGGGFNTPTDFDP